MEAIEYSNLNLSSRLPPAVRVCCVATRHHHYPKKNKNKNLLLSFKVPRCFHHHQSTIMGCAQTKQSMNSPPRVIGLEKLKLDSDYAPLPKRPVSKNQERGIGRYYYESDDEIKKEVEVPKAKVVEDTVGGWPKWLTSNIPMVFLDGFVPRSAESFDKLAKVGQGTYSNVYKARDRDTGKIVALKKVRFDTSEPESIRFMAREILILQKLDHPNIIKLEGIATSRMPYSLYLVFEFMHSDLGSIISRPEGRLTEPQVKCYMQQLLSGLMHCHEKGILHRDIKGSNLLVDKQGMLKIADFGLANNFSLNKKRLLTSRVVTLWYRAPELLLGSTDYGVGIDLWSAGCLLAEMFIGQPIMPGRTEVEQLHRIFKLCGSPPEDYWRKLKLSTTFRPPQSYKSKFVEAFEDFPSSSLGLLQILLALDPSLRGSAASTLQNEFFSSNPLACDLSGLPVVYKQEDDESIKTRALRKRRSAKLKQRSHMLKEGPRNEEQDLAKQEVGDYGRLKEEAEVRTVYSHDLGSSTAGSASSGPQPEQCSVSIPPPRTPSFSHRQRLGAHPSYKKNIRNSLSHQISHADVKWMNNQQYGIEKRSVSTSAFRMFDEKQIPKR